MEHKCNCVDGHCNRPVEMVQRGKANVVVDGQWGSTGKGKVLGMLYNSYMGMIGFSVCDFMPNAGHTYVDNFGNAHVLRLLPMGMLFNVPVCCIGPHAAINLDVFKEEMAKMAALGSTSQLFIHPMASVITPMNLEFEKQFNTIASTMKGGGAATIGKMLRDPSRAMLAKDCPDLRPYLADTFTIVNNEIDAGHTGMLETAQGFDLGLNNGNDWPHVTSRDTLIGRAFDNAGLSPKYLGSVTAVLRTFPIRVGHTEGGHSGGCYKDQYELTWEKISELAAMPVCEKTTVTKRVRRVFSFSSLQLLRFMRIVRPDFVFLNFVNYLHPSHAETFLSGISDVCEHFNSNLVMCGTGPKDNDVFFWPEGFRQWYECEVARRQSMEANSK